MPSPTCEVKDGAGAYASTTNGVDVTPANTITIKLSSSAGVSSWSISCITTDEDSVAATVTSSLTIDTAAKTATFTAPVAGRAYRFQSRVNGGIDVNGVSQSSYTTTFCVYTLTAASKRVGAADETYEGDSTFGWASRVNDLVREMSFSTYDGTTLSILADKVANTTDSKVTSTTIPTNLQTTNATPTVLQTFTVGSVTGIVNVRSIVTASDSSGTNTGSWAVDLAYKNVSGTLTQLGTGGVTAYGTPTATLAVAASTGTGTVILTATGVAATTIRWTSNGFQNVAIGT